MDIGESIIIGRMGQQPLHIADTTVDPQHALLKKTAPDTFQIIDNNSAKGIYVFGLRIKRKAIKEDTPLFFGGLKTSVRQLLKETTVEELQKIWDDYNKNKIKWDRYTMMVNSIRMLTPIITMSLTQFVGQNWMVSCIVLVVVMAIAIIAGEKVLEKKNMAMAELTAKMQSEYVCMHCNRFLGFLPYNILKGKGYCPHCGVPLK